MALTLKKRSLPQKLAIVLILKERRLPRKLAIVLNLKKKAASKASYSADPEKRLSRKLATVLTLNKKRRLPQKLAIYSADPQQKKAASKAHYAKNSFLTSILCRKQRKQVCLQKSQVCTGRAKA